jgi:peptidoglycan hydrolase FlgJ
MAIRTDMGSAGSLAIDSQSLDQLRLQAKQKPDQALKAAAQQFEAVFLNMMLKSMREATPQDGMFDNEQTKMFTSMLDQQLAQAMSARGVGLADVMVRQLSGSFGTKAPVAPAGSVPASIPVSISPQTSATLTPAGVTASSAPQPPESGVPSAYNATFQQDFVQRFAPYAMQASSETGVPAHLMLGQAALESGWGQREIRLPDGNSSYNLFGIKAGGNWKGKVAEVTTTEYYNGVPRKQVEKFRAYSSYAEAFRDYAHLLSSNPRYAGVMRKGLGVTELAQSVQRAGYATDPAYAIKLASVMNRISTAG